MEPRCYYIKEVVYQSSEWVSLVNDGWVTATVTDLPPYRDEWLRAEVVPSGQIARMIKEA